MKKSFDLLQVEKLSGLGLSLDKIASILGTSRDYFRELCKKDDALQNAVDRGRAVAEEQVSRCAFDMATSGQYPNMTLGWLKMRAG